MPKAFLMRKYSYRQYNVKDDEDRKKPVYHRIETVSDDSPFDDNHNMYYEQTKRLVAKQQWADRKHRYSSYGT